MQLRHPTLFALIIMLAACGDRTSTSTVKPDNTQKNDPRIKGQGRTEFEPIEETSLFGDSLYGSDNKPLRNPILTEDALPKHLLEKGAAAFSKSLETGNRRMVYSAAVASVELNPKQDFENREMVMPAIAEAIHLTGVRNIYVISHNANLRNQIRKFCRDNGYVYDGGNSAISALKDLRHSSARDLIVIDSGLRVTDSKGKAAGENNEFPRIRTVETGDRNIPVNALFAREVFIQVRKDVRTGHIPVVIIANNEGNDSEISAATAKTIYGDGIAGVVPKPFNSESLKELTTGLFHRQDKLAEDSKAEAEAVAVRACRAVARLRGKTTLFNVSVVSEALMEAFREPADGQTARVPVLREAAIRAMQTVSASESFGPLLAVANNTNNQSEVRAAAIDCLGTLYKSRPGIVVGADRVALVEMLSNRLRENDKAIWRSAANTLGHLELSAEERTKLAVAHRLNRTRKY